MIAVVAHFLASIDPSIFDGSMLHVAPSPGELFHFVRDSLPMPGTIVVEDSIPDAHAIQSYWVPRPGEIDEVAYEVVASSEPSSAVVVPASEGFPPSINWVAFAARAFGAGVAALLCLVYFRWSDKRAEDTASDRWWVEHEERLQWVRHFIMTRQPQRALYELEYVLGDL